MVQKNNVSVNQLQDHELLQAYFQSKQLTATAQEQEISSFLLNSKRLKDLNTLHGNALMSMSPPIKQSAKVY